MVRIHGSQTEISRETRVRVPAGERFALDAGSPIMPTCTCTSPHCHTTALLVPGITHHQAQLAASNVGRGRGEDVGAPTVCSCARLHHCCRPTGPHPAAARSTAAPAIHSATSRRSPGSCAQQRPLRMRARAAAIYVAAALPRTAACHPSLPAHAQRIAFDAASRALPCTAAAQVSWGWQEGVDMPVLVSGVPAAEPGACLANCSSSLAWRNLALLSVPAVSPALHRLRPAAAPRNRAAPARARAPAAPRAVSPCSQHHF